MKSCKQGHQIFVITPSTPDIKGSSDFTCAECGHWNPGQLGHWYCPDCSSVICGSCVYKPDRYNSITCPSSYKSHKASYQQSAPTPPIIVQVQFPYMPYAPQPAPPMPYQAPPRPNEEHKSGQGACKICYRTDSQLKVLRPCGHASICENCISHLNNQCPFCRVQIESSENFFMP